MNTTRATHAQLPLSSMRVKARRFVVLLEVLIAFALVALCVLPLIYPHVAIYRAERQFVDTVKLDHDVSLLYAVVLQKLYNNAIPFSDIENAARLPVDERMLQEAGIKDALPFDGTYRFTIEDKRLLKPIPKMFLVGVEFSFMRKGIPANQQREDQKPLEYKYLVFIERKVPESASEEEP